MQTIELSQTWHQVVIATAKTGGPRSMSKVFDEVSEHFTGLLGDRCIEFKGRMFPPDCKVVEDLDPFLWFGNVESGNIPLMRYKKKYGTKWSDAFMLELFDMFYLHKTWPGANAVSKCESIKNMLGEKLSMAIKILESAPR